MNSWDTKKDLTVRTKVPQNTFMKSKVDKSKWVEKEFKALRSIKFLDSHICFEKGEKFEFLPGLNVLVGDQGSGKSTLLRCLNNDQDDAWKLDVDSVESRFLDTEKDNPRIASDLSYSKNIMFSVQSRFMSHGQTLLPMILACGGMHDVVLFVDEPEAGLSIRSQIKVAKAIAEASKYNQVFVCTHSAYIMQMAERVLDLEKRAWVSPGDFIEGQKI